MNIREPKESNFYAWEKGGTPLNREAAKASCAIEEIWRVADFVVESDSAISSYLNGNGVDAVGRKEREAHNAVLKC